MFKIANLVQSAICRKRTGNSKWAFHTDRYSIFSILRMQAKVFCC